MICETCGATVPDSWPSCLDCGTLTGAGAMGADTGSDEEVFPLLATANLSRTRGNFADAEAQCTAILERFPNHPAAHSLLGEIYEDQSLFDEAITCYQLALELDPRNEKDRRLLARALDRQSIAARKILERPVASTRSRLAPGPAGVPIPFWILLGVLTVLCLSLGAYAVYVVKNSGWRSHGGGPSIDTGAPAGLAGSPIAETAQELAVQKAINETPSRNIPLFTVDHLEMEPRSRGAYGILTINVNEPLQANGARNSVLRVSGAAAQAAAVQHLDRVTLRVMGVAGTAPTALVFEAEINPAALNGLDPSTFTLSPDINRFENVWWNPSLP